MRQKNQALYIFLLFTFSTNLPENSTDLIAPSVYNFSPVVNDLQLQQWLSKSRLVIIPTIIAIALYVKKESMVDMIADYPLTFLATTCFTCNYLIDTFSKYRQINQTLNCFLFSQSMSRYMLCAMAIRNTMKEQREIKHISFDEHDFFKTIATETGHSFQELESFTFELINSSLHSISSLCIDINKTDIEEKIYFLFKDKISIEQMLLLSKNDKKMHSELLKFYNNPEQQYSHITTTLCALLKKHLSCFL
ncbi:MAG: hypothetical protein NTZ68_03755 [Candidatus Dependentiae bacterium]|nr:hypothetical protein [Candidatus Dependentiae bacterium]